MSGNEREGFTITYYREPLVQHWRYPKLMITFSKMSPAFVKPLSMNKRGIFLITTNISLPHILTSGILSSRVYGKHYKCTQSQSPVCAVHTTSP